MVLFTSIVLIILTFFIMMTAKANYDEVKHDKVVESVYDSFGIFSGGYAVIGSDQGVSSNLPSIGDPSAMASVSDNEMARIRALLSPELLDGGARIVHNRGQRIITLSADLLFAPGSWELGRESQEMLLAFCRIMRRVSIPVYIEGHTDNLPSTVEGHDNWDISARRAVAVLEFFAGPGGLDLDSLSAYGYAGTKPIYANNTPARRARNNRVDLVLDYEATRAGAVRGLESDDRSFEFDGFEFLLPERPGDEGEVY
jgi:chemotaxis protein MotB